MTRRWLLLLLLTVVAAGCATGAESVAEVQPRDGRSGLHLTGTVDGRQVSVADGLPRLEVGDCDPALGPDQDVCAISRTIDGQLFVLVFENPAALQADSVLEVADPGCPTEPECDEVTDVAVVDVQIDTGPRQRAVAGRLELTVVQPRLRYAGRVALELPDGRLNGSFDLVPRPD